MLAHMMRATVAKDLGRRISEANKLAAARRLTSQIVQPQEERQ